MSAPAPHPAGPKGGTHTQWDDIHARLRELGEHLARAGEPGAREQQRILRERAEVLARKDPPASVETSLDLVTFSLAGGQYGLQSRLVKEAQTVREITSLPGMPETISGIFNHRGRLLTLLNLKSLLGLPRVGLSDFHTVLVLESQPLEMALLVDGLSGVRSVPTRELQSGMAGLGAAAERLLLGIAPDGLTVLDGTKLSAEMERELHAQA